MIKFKLLLITAGIVCLLNGCTKATIQIYDLRCENLVNPLSIEGIPHLSWKLKSNKNGEKQTAFQLLLASDKSLLEAGTADLWDSGKIYSSESVMFTYEGDDLSSIPLVYWKVRVWDSANNATPWSEPVCFGTGLTENEIKTASYLTLPKSLDNAQYPLLRKQFDSGGKQEKTLLYVNSLGYHEVYLNGEKIGDDVLAPAVSQLNKRSLYNTYDITSHVKEGKNDLVIWIGRGWYIPRLYNGYEKPLAKAWIKKKEDNKWNMWFTSDKSWFAAKSGIENIGARRAFMFWGGHTDASAMPENMNTTSLDKLEWYPADEVKIPEHAVSPQMVEGNQVIETIKARHVKQLSDSVWLVDMGQALTGWAEIKFPALPRGQKVVMTYADHFDSEENLANQNQEDEYIASGKQNEVFCSKFNYYSFQYIKISGLPTAPDKNDITASLIRPAFKQTSSFSCSDKDMNAIHDMIQYTLSNLSLGGYLVDCQHLERLGYGGDGNASTETAQTMFALSPLYANWMQAWGDCIREEGSMPHVAPTPHSAGGGPYWCGFVITASWRTYINYGDSRLIEKYYPVMQQWLGYVDKYTIDGLLEPWPPTEYRNWYLGDWACPKGVDQTNPASISVVANSFICVCYETMEKIAEYLGKPEDIKRYAEKKEQLQKRIQEVYYSDEEGVYATGSQIDQVYPMLSGVTPASLLEKVTQRLFYETEQNRQGHLACGLVGIPVLTEWAVKNKQPDFIYAMLKKRDYPGYLYMIDNGATATWEHWDGERSRMHNCYNGIGSWFYQAIGGIRPDEEEPGYKKVWIEPQIPKGVTWAKTTKETPYGLLSVDWELKGNEMDIDLTIPIGCTAYVVLPQTTGEYKLNNQLIKKGKNNNIILEAGRYRIAFNKRM